MLHNYEVRLCCNYDPQSNMCTIPVMADHQPRSTPKDGQRAGGATSPPLSVACETLSAVHPSNTKGTSLIASDTGFWSQDHERSTTMTSALA